MSTFANIIPDIRIEVLDSAHDGDIRNMAEAVLSLPQNKNSFNIGGYHNESKIDELISHFRGTLLIPNAILIVGRYDGVIAGAIQIIRHSNKSFAFSCNFQHHFVTSWARGYGMSRFLLEEAENQAKVRNIRVIKLSIRADNHEAIELYQQYGYIRWGTLENYEMLSDNVLIPGFFYHKEI